MSDTRGPATVDEDDLDRMSLMEHLEELRKRIFTSLGVFAVAFMACFTFSKRIFDFLTRPIDDLVATFPEQMLTEDLVVTTLPAPFLVQLKVAALAGIFAAAPFILYQLWAFVAPGLYKKERRMAGPFILFGTLLFLAGGSFAYWVAFPFAGDFFLKTAQELEIVLLPDSSSYLHFLMTCILGLGLMFELPTVIFFLTRMGLVTPGFLLRHFRWAVLIIFIAAALITPTPDVINLCIFALPTIVLYLVGVAVAWIFSPGRDAVKGAAPAAD